MLVKDHIRRNIITLPDTADFRQALETMVEHKTNGLIVVDSEMKPVGAIDSFLLIRTMVPDYLRLDPSLAQFEPEGVFYKLVSSALNKPVKEIMQELHGVRVKENDPMILAATLAAKHSYRYIPVCDDDDKLVGLVSRTDIKRAMAELLNINDTPKT
ncbi:MAG: hypothetical protein COW24_01665 [Candidatus Kerfeldbacteria bacterium CG15_BIG_FIL_POST_REV_8_21_14_020_45_12]|uniref:CBS domain-containing protein n=1 Tax=Candidatus Kerfeldbacteria bacterium CG15_BIG_FIL_POST_REV_8_21_14_020_45_12 TaxID=2014247 RepID=A0A2M7H4J2_9BACT|nr:MAG: hypothetical protein COW24_01665 [Candidatus Kerfeldbacteria bacterium CG15_BIG_FIL_POST_REV_8_21_14_020_45_12]PJA92926.1 MAG: hypothetical protein CO132_05455 [Candidatus Kerfeldbacteria bacterium CG_4_9_14_3_um_filter_45_8]